MARKTDDIIVLMDDTQATKTALTTLNSPSQTADYTLWKETIAYNMNIEEQLWDTYRDELNAAIALAAPGTAAWIQAQVFKFQYSALTPQILQLINFAPSYTTVDTTLQIVTRCSVKTDLKKVVQIKVAKSEPPVALSALEYSSLTGYLNSIMFAGIGFGLISQASDKMYMVADVYYDGQYAATIQDDVETSIEAYLKAIPFDGVMLLSDLQQAVKNTPGVKDIEIATVKCRPDATVLASASVIYDLATSINVQSWNTNAGYIVGETTPGSTLSDTITYKVA